MRERNCIHACHLFQNIANIFSENEILLTNVNEKKKAEMKKTDDDNIPK